jgi:UDPglucose 6-dehydrogenase
LKISVIGTGYVGLVTGGCLAQIGHDVLCTDNDASKIKILEDGGLPIYEPGLEKIIEQARREKRLSFSANPADAARGDVVFICVGTPPLANGDADLSAIDHVARTIATKSTSSKLVVEKSTVPARTGEELKRALSVYGRKSNLKFRVASNPEFLREGTAVEDFLHPDRIVVGAEDEETEKQMREIYRPVLERKFACPFHAPKPCPAGPPPQWVVTTINSAELIKHASNSFLALKISYANMVSDLAEALGADIKEVMHAVGLDPRIGTSFLNPGLGFGGFCLPKDLQAFVHLAERYGVDFTMLREAERINKKRVTSFVEKVRQALWVIKGKQIGVLGLAFKANTDDVRFAPAIDLIQHLIGEHAHVKAYDPEALERARAILPNVDYVKSAYDAAENSEALVIATEWDEFRKLDWDRVRDLMARPLILDGRNLLSPSEIRARGFEYHCFGRPTTGHGQAGAEREAEVLSR